MDTVFWLYFVVDTAQCIIDTTVFWLCLVVGTAQYIIGTTVFWLRLVLDVAQFDLCSDNNTSEFETTYSMVSTHN